MFPTGVGMNREHRFGHGVHFIMFPTGVGMNRVMGRSLVWMIYVPHRRGDEPIAGC